MSETPSRSSLSNRRKDSFSLPFGIGATKPKHFRDMFKIGWENRDNLGYAWKVLSKGVCDGCALGVAGFHDWTIKGTHLCMTRLNLLRLNTMSEMEHSLLGDISHLSDKDNRELRNLGRLAYPMVRKPGADGFQRISWDTALDLIADELGEFDPRRIAFFVTSRGVTNEVYYVAQKAARALGSSNIDNAARICHSPSTAAMKRTLGVAATTCSYGDWFGTDLIVFFGSNPANDQPVATKYLHEAKKQGTEIAFVNPYREPGMEKYWVPSSADSALFGTKIVDHWFPVKQGGDIAFLYAVIKILMENDWIEESFLARSVEGVDELREVVDRLDFEMLAAQSGLSKDEVHVFADLIRSARNAVLVWSMGITQHEFGADAVQMILNLGLLRGYVGRDKCGLMPIRGHSSVQGGAEMGAYATAFPGGKPINEETAGALSEAYGFEVPASEGLSGVEMIDAAHRGDLDLLYSVGGNFLRNLPDPDYVAEAMSRPKLRIHQDIILNDQMLLPSEGTVLLLPARTRYEQEGGGIETTTERRIIFSPEIPRQVGEARSEWRILRDLTLRLKPELADAFACDSGEAIREEIAKIVPIYEGIQNLKTTGDSVQYGGPHLCEGGVFPLPNGKAKIFAPEIPRLEPKEGELLLSTRRGKQFNSLIYAERDPLNGADREDLLMNAVDVDALGLENGDLIRVFNDIGEMKARVFVTDISKGDVQAHWPESNVLIPTGPRDAGGGVPDYNAYVRIEKLEV